MNIPLDNHKSVEYRVRQFIVRVFFLLLLPFAVSTIFLLVPRLSAIVIVSIFRFISNLALPLPTDWIRFENEPFPSQHSFCIPIYVVWSSITIYADIGKLRSQTIHSYTKSKRKTKLSLNGGDINNMAYDFRLLFNDEITNIWSTNWN